MPSHEPTAMRPRRRLNAHLRGFTLMELMIALGAIAVTVSAAFAVLNRMNQTAFANRLYSEAQAVCENQVDAFLTKGPFDLTTTPQRIPTELALGTTTKNGVLVYVDPVTNQIVVTGQMITTVTDTASTQTVNGKTVNLNVRRAKVEVTYNYRSQTYSVVMNTLRTADQ